jgi:hypothetical protein
MKEGHLIATVTHSSDGLVEQSEAVFPPQSALPFAVAANSIARQCVSESKIIHYARTTPS